MRTLKNEELIGQGPFTVHIIFHKTESDLSDYNSCQMTQNCITKFPNYLSLLSLKCIVNPFPEYFLVACKESFLQAKIFLYHSMHKINKLYQKIYTEPTLHHLTQNKIYTLSLTSFPTAIFLTNCTDPVPSKKIHKW